MSDLLVRWLIRIISGSFGLIRRLLGLAPPAVPRDPVPLLPIAVVRNNVSQPRPYGWQDVRSDIIVRSDLIDALHGIEGYSHIIVVFSCHQVPDDARVTGHLKPTDDDRLPAQGVLATRSQLRPSAIGVSVVPLLRRRGAILRVAGLDAINGTPVLDIKPYLPYYDSIDGATVPDWVHEFLQQQQQDEAEAQPEPE